MVRTPLYFIVLFLVILTLACASANLTNLRRETIKDEKTITGSFTLILYGNRHGDDLETVAFMDIEGDEHIFEPYAREYNYSVKMHQESEEALKKGIAFVRRHESFKGVRISKIIDKQDRILGYELRPFYRDTRFRVPDVLNVSYVLKEKKVVIYIRLKNYIKKQLERDRRDFFR